MPFSKNKIKFLSIASAGALIFWISVQVKKTREILNGAFDPYILHVVEPKTVDRDVYPVSIDAPRWIKPPNSEEPYYVTKWKELKFAYARRLLSLTKAENQVVRQKATQKLAGIKDLESWQYSLLANSSTARTAAALARTPEADLRFQIQPYVSPEQCKEEYLVHILKEYLVNLEEKTGHPCINNFLSNSFADIQDMSKLFESYYDHTDHMYGKYVKSSADMLPLCLETILHHSTIEHYGKDVVENNGLYLLLEVYFRYRHIYEINIALCTIISNVSVCPGVAEELHKTGWIALLAKWARDTDIRLSVTASRALANLDFDDPTKPRYERGIYSLYPLMRTEEPAKVDIVFIHGLLGGVFYTWRQRNPQDSALSIIETITGEPELWTLKRYYSSDPVMRDYLDRCEEQEKIEWEALGSDYDIVSYDLPVSANKDSDGAYSCSGYDKLSCEEPKTQCWPKDWLTCDCNNLRIIGVNYDTSLSKWAGTCPEESSKMTLDQRTEDLLEKLQRAGVGRRPIVWVSHSMGGLLVKNIICRAREKGGEFRSIVDNSKGIVFYSTPHNGSKIANLNPPTSLVVLPSVEVQELREESPNLKIIHDKFLDMLKYTPMKIISFVETKSTVVTALKFNFLMVEPKSGNPGVGEIFEVPLDHLGICKPVNRESFLYQKVLNLVKDVLDEEAKKESQKSIENHVKHCGTQFC